MSMNLQLNEYQLTTAEILYHFPDYPTLLQTYIWQEYDLFPKLPVLHKFLEFWYYNLDGQLHSVTVAGISVIQAPKFQAVTLTLQ